MCQNHGANPTFKNVVVFGTVSQYGIWAQVTENTWCGAKVAYSQVLKHTIELNSDILNCHDVIAGVHW